MTLVARGSVGIPNARPGMLLQHAWETRHTPKVFKLCKSKSCIGKAGNELMPWAGRSWFSDYLRQRRQDSEPGEGVSWAGLPPESQVAFWGKCHQPLWGGDRLAKPPT